MASETLTPDGNTRNISGAVTDDSNAFIKKLRIDDTTKGLKVMVVGGGGLGSVTSVSVATANGFSGTVANATTTPAITIIAGAITPSSVNGVVLSGSATPTLAVTGTSSISGSNTGDVANTAITTNPLSQFASTTSAQLAGVLSDETGTGVAVFNNKPTFLGTIQTITAIGALAFDGSTGNMFTKTIGSPSTFTQSNFSTGQNFIITVTGAVAITWFTTIRWITVGAVAPTQGAVTVYGFTCTSANNFDGFLVSSQ